jgi:serine/threonine protein kinase
MSTPEGQPIPSFGRYRDPVMLGSGGMGAVYKATDPSLDRFVAIKVLTHREPRYVERFRREAQVLAKIMHPSIIQIYEIVGSDDDGTDPYIVMEYFEGKPLDSALKMGPMSATQVISIMRQTAEGLRKAHANHVIHRDIKPANLMIAPSGDAKILDFGIAKATDAKKDLTGQTVLGTPYYMSPEQAMGQPIDGRTDIYSLGITAFHLLTGRRPFEAKSKVDVMLMQVKNPLPSLRDFVEVDEQIQALVEKMCSKQPGARHQTCQELIDAIDSLPRSLGGKQSTAPTMASAPLRPPEVQAPVAPRPAVRTAPTPGVRKTPAPPPPVRPAARPSSQPAPRPDVRRAPPPEVPRPSSKAWQGVALGVLAAVLLLGAVGVFLWQRSASHPGAWRVPAKGWLYPGAPAPPLKRVQSAGGYGNCVFSTREVERGKEDAATLRTIFTGEEPILSRCYFAHQVGPNKAGEVWEDLWIDGQKRAQLLFDPALPNDDDQIGLEIGKRHQQRFAELSPGKHTIDIWIYRQSDEAENPEPLAAGELTLRR